MYKFNYQEMKNRMYAEFKTGGKKYTAEILLENFESRTNWGHKGKVILTSDADLFDMEEAKIIYYNRTWESYTYQSLIHKLIGKLKAPEAVKDKLAKYIDRKNGVKAL